MNFLNQVNQNFRLNLVKEFHIKKSKENDNKLNTSKHDYPNYLEYVSNDKFKEYFFKLHKGFDNNYANIFSYEDDGSGNDFSIIESFKSGKSTHVNKKTIFPINNKKQGSGVYAKKTKLPKNNQDKVYVDIDSQAKMQPVTLKGIEERINELEESIIDTNEYIELLENMPSLGTEESLDYLKKLESSYEKELRKLKKVKKSKLPSSNKSINNFQFSKKFLSEQYHQAYGLDSSLEQVIITKKLIKQNYPQYSKKIQHLLTRKAVIGKDRKLITPKNARKLETISVKKLIKGKSGDSIKKDFNNVIQIVSKNTQNTKNAKEKSFLWNNGTLYNLSGKTTNTYKNNHLMQRQENELFDFHSIKGGVYAFHTHPLGLLNKMLNQAIEINQQAYKRSGKELEAMTSVLSNKLKFIASVPSIPDIEACLTKKMLFPSMRSSSRLRYGVIGPANKLVVVHIQKPLPTTQDFQKILKVYKERMIYIQRYKDIREFKRFNRKNFRKFLKEFEIPGLMKLKIINPAKVK
ncbi:hypothetical protein ACFL2K_00905 [Candidatus Margulisiibacteriota bacterium]